MKKFIGITVLGIVAINLISFIYFSFVYYPKMYYPSALDELAFLGVRFGLCIAFGIWLATYRYKGCEIDNKNTISRFFKQNRIALALVVIAVILVIAEGNIRSVYDDLRTRMLFFSEMYHYDVSGNYLRSAVSTFGPFKTPVEFHCLLFFHLFGEVYVHLSYVALYFTYRIRAARYVPRGKGEIPVKSPVQ